jgi:hypothetical protein
MAGSIRERPDRGSNTWELRIFSISNEDERAAEHMGKLLDTSSGQ